MDKKKIDYVFGWIFLLLAIWSCFLITKDDSNIIVLITGIIVFIISLYYIYKNGE